MAIRPKTRTPEPCVTETFTNFPDLRTAAKGIVLIDLCKTVLPGSSPITVSAGGRRSSQIRRRILEVLKKPTAALATSKTAAFAASRYRQRRSGIKRQNQDRQQAEWEGP